MTGVLSLCKISLYDKGFLAFMNKKNGEIRIDAINQTDNSVIIDYRDNGQWIEPSRKSSFGLELIETFTEQLDGSVEPYSDKGTHYRIVFPKLVNL